LFADIIYFGILFGGRNPLYVGGVFAVFLLIKALWVQLDISGEFRNGAVSFKPVSFLVPLPRTSYFQQIPLTLETSILTETTKLFKLAFKISCLFKLLVSVLSKLVVCLQLPGLLSLSTKFLPTTMNLIRRLAEGQKPMTTDPRRNPALASKFFQNGSSSFSDSSSSASSGITSPKEGNEYSSTLKDD
jgi:hypothetical protein